MHKRSFVDWPNLTSFKLIALPLLATLNSYLQIPEMTLEQGFGQYSTQLITSLNEYCKYKLNEIHFNVGNNEYNITPNAKGSGWSWAN